MRCGFLLGDQSAALFATVGILSATIERQKTGKGRAIDVSMQAGLFSMIMDDTWELVLAEGLPVRTGNRIARLAPFSVYAAQDGYVVICTASDEQWQNVLRAIGREDLKEDPRYCTSASRVKNVREVEALIGNWMREKSTQEALDGLRKNRVPCSHVLEIQDVLQDPQLKHRGMMVDLAHPVYGKIHGATGSGFPIRYSEMNVQYDHPAPRLGEHNEEIYSGLLGYDQEKLARLKKEGII